jgi:hypothetical protein
MSAARPASVDDKGLAGDVARCVAGEETKWAVQFVQPAAGGAGEEAWGERVDSDSGGAPSGGEFAGEGDDTGWSSDLISSTVLS